MNLSVVNFWQPSASEVPSVARAKLLFLHLVMPEMQSRKLSASVRLQIFSFFPNQDFAFLFRRETNAGVAVWAWPLDKENPLANSPRLWPEPLLDEGCNGFRLIKRDVGFEGQYWDEAKNLRQSQWWSAAPTSIDWGRFVRASSKSEVTEIPQPVVPSRAKRVQAGWKRGDSLPAPDPWRGWRWQLTSLFIASACTLALGVHLRTKQELQRDKETLKGMLLERSAALDQQAKYAKLKQEYDSLYSLSPKVSQLELIGKVLDSGVLNAPSIPNPLPAAASSVGGGLNIPPPVPQQAPLQNPLLSEWDFRNGQLKMTLEIPEGEVAMLATTRRIEELANFSGLKIGLESSANNLTLNVKVNDFFAGKLDYSQVRK